MNLRFQDASGAAAESSFSAADRAAEGKSEFSHFHFKVQPETHFKVFFNCWALAEVLISPKRNQPSVLFSFFNFAHTPTCEVI